MKFFSTMRAWWGAGALADRVGTQIGTPSHSLNPGTRSVDVDGALQISTVWACVDRRGGAVASMPCFVYRQLANGEKTLARTERLYQLLHDQPNNRMTPFEFWRAMMLNYDLRGNAYARIDRDANGEALALWPMPAHQVEPQVSDDGSMVYVYRIGANVAVLAADNVLHLKNLGNGTTGLDKLEFMRATLDEQAKAQLDASKIFGAGGKPAGLLMIDKVLNEKQRENAKRTFADMTLAPDSRLHLLEGDMKFQQLALTPAEQQLLETRHYGVEELCRWFDVPPVLVHHSGVTTWGSGIAEIRDGWCIFSIGPLVVNMQQAIRRCVLTPRQRAYLTVEFSLDALLRASPSLRVEINAKNVQNGLKSRAEVRQMEGDPYIAGTEVLTAQSNLVPLHMLGRIAPAGGGNGSNIAQ